MGAKNSVPKDKLTDVSKALTKKKPKKPKKPKPSVFGEIRGSLSEADLEDLDKDDLLVQAFVYLYALNNNDIIWTDSDQKLYRNLQDETMRILAEEKKKPTAAVSKNANIALTLYSNTQNEALDALNRMNANQLSNIQSLVRTVVHIQQLKQWQTKIKQEQFEKLMKDGKLEQLQDKVRQAELQHWIAHIEHKKSELLAIMLTINDPQLKAHLKKRYDQLHKEQTNIMYML